MPDEIKGVAVLDDRPGCEEVLFIVCVAEDPRKSGPFIGRLNVRRRGEPHPPDRPSWEYDEPAPGLLRVTPSVRVSTTRPIPGSPDNEEIETFHNGGDWTVKFVRWSALGLPDGPDDPGRWTYCNELNRALLG